MFTAMHLEMENNNVVRVFMVVVRVKARVVRNKRAIVVVMYSV
jgi:hypothetical protein